MCSSRRSKQTGHVGSSVCPEGAERAGLFARLSEMNSTSLTYNRRQTISGSSEENCIQKAHRTGDPQSGSLACRVITEQGQKTWRIMLCNDTWQQGLMLYRLVVIVYIELICSAGVLEVQENHA